MFHVAIIISKYFISNSAVRNTQSLRSNAKRPVVSRLAMLLLHSWNHLGWRTAYVTAAVHCCHSLGTTGTEQRMSTQYESDASDEAYMVGVGRLRVV